MPGSNIDSKFTGLLHDPVDKILRLRGHAERAENIAKKLVKNLKQNILNDIKNHHPYSQISPADHNASAANRGLIPHGSKVDEIVFQNPFSGYIIRLNRFAQKQIMQVDYSVFQSIAQYPNEFGKLYWNLMHSYYQAYSRLHQVVAQSIFILPEDTRIPSSPIISHLMMTSALSGCTENFYLISIEVGGVQEFISSARKTADLWAGSYIFSLLLASAIRYFVREFGPDSILIPWILEIPLIDALIFGGNIDRDVLLPLIPNTLTAIVCLDKVKPEDLRARVHDELKRMWGNIVDLYIEYLQGKLSGVSLNKKIIEESLDFDKIFNKVRIVSLSYANAKRSNINSLLNQSGLYQQINQIPHRKCQYSCRGCDTYRDHLEYRHQPLENFENYIKILQLSTEYSKYSIRFKGAPEEFSPKEKACLACGSFRQARFSDDQNINEQAWNILEKNYIVDIGERLCHVCLLKRTLRYFIYKIFNRDKETQSPRPRLFLIPSTSDFGVMWFKVSILAVFLGILKSNGMSREEKIKIFNEARRLIEDLATKLEKIAEYLGNLGFEKKMEECKSVPPYGIIAQLYRELEENDIIEEIAREEGESPRGYLESIGIRTIICAPGELFESEGLITLLSREDLTDVREQVKDLIDSIEDSLKEWHKFVNSEIVQDIIPDARRVIAKTIALIFANNDERYRDLYYDILNEIYSSLYHGSENRNKDFAEVIPIAVKPQEGLRVCVIRADGDSMGKWINGTMRLPWVLMHHPQIIPQIQTLRNINRDILSREAPISPAYLSTLSMTLSYNALLVAHIIEAFGGFLIYTGGDDILAMLPPEVWHLVYLLLRFTFSCEIIFNRAIKKFNDGIYSYGVSWRATQSYGVVIAHHKADFRWVIEMSRDLEERSKNLSLNGESQKDAISVALLSRGAIIGVSEPLPNVLISYDRTLQTIREFDEFAINQVRQNVMQSDVMDNYNEPIKQFLTLVTSRVLGDDVAFIGIIPRTHKITTSDPVIVTLLAFAYKVAHMVSTGKLSRAGLYLLQEFYGKFSDIKKQQPTDAQLEIFKYQLERKIQQEHLRKVIAKDLIESTRVLIDLSKKFSSNFLSVYSLAEIIRRSLSNCIIW